MPPEGVPSLGTQPSSDDAHRKLWFEYLAKLNDRELQYSRASGFTPWALLAVAAAIIYQGVPQIPAFLSISGGMRTSIVVMGLEADVLLWGSAFVLALTLHCAPGIQARLLPEHNKRVGQIILGIALAMIGAMAAGHFLAWAFHTGSPFVRWVLLAFGIFYLLVLVGIICVEAHEAKKAKKHKLPIPAFSFPRALSDFGSFIGAAVVLPVAVIALATLLIYLRALHSAAIAWTMPLAAATDLLVLAMVFYRLLITVLGSTSTIIFLALERDVVLENLPPSEIKARFIREALGPLVGDWLERLNQERQESLSSLVRLTESLTGRVEKIEAIDPGYSHEREGRAKKALEELDEAINRCIGELRGFLFQLEQVTYASISAREARILSSIREGWKAENDLRSAHELKKRLLALVKSPKQQT